MPLLALGCFTAALLACTLTDGGFDPRLVEGEPNIPATTACESGAACCAGTPCAGDAVCREGVCLRVVPPAPSADAGGCAGSECPLPEAVPLPVAPPEPTCDDGLLGPNEADIDCGGVCAAACGTGLRCDVDGDCAAGLICGAGAGRCAAPSCVDGMRDGDEVDVDCGGGSCPGCADGSPCNASVDCLSGVCDESGRCAAPSCEDGVTNGGEVDVDCGGACAACATARACNVARDCQSQVCSADGCGAGADLCCQAPSCADGVRNGGEVDVDCGGDCGPCPLAADCAQDEQCQSGFCEAGLCADPGSCDDGVRNGRESSVDCGGDRCGLCADRLPCNQASDCRNDNCFDGVCISCGSGVIDGTETDVDCGGADPFCRRCNPGQRCLVGSDCLFGACNGGFC